MACSVQSVCVFVLCNLFVALKIGTFLYFGNGEIRCFISVISCDKLGLICSLDEIICVRYDERDISMCIISFCSMNI